MGVRRGAFPGPLALLALLAAGCAGSSPPAGAPAPAAAPAGSTKVRAPRPTGSPPIARLADDHPRLHLRPLRPGARTIEAALPPEPPVAPPVLTPRGVRWPRAREGAESFLVPAGAIHHDRDSTLVVDSLVLWRLRAEDPALREPSLLRWADLLLADGDTLRADSVLAAPGLAESVWAWDALRTRVRLAAARGDTVAADTLLTRAGRRGWPDADFAAHALESARAALARGDSVRALRRATDCVQRFPGLSPAVAALQLLDTLTAARGETLLVPLAREAAEVEALRGAPATAAARLEALIARAPAADRAGIRFRAGEMWRRARRWDQATHSLEAALPGAPDSNAATRIRLELARTLRDRGRADEALAAYDRADRRTAYPPLAEAIRWERARELQDLGRFERAERAFDAAAALGGRRAEEARHLAGLMALLAGRTGEALERWDGNSLEAARFWRGVVLRGRGDPRGDSLLRTVATPAGYGFYAAAARETLGVRGFPGGVPLARAEADSGSGARVLALARAGLFDEAMTLANRRAARDPRLGAAPLTPGEALAFAQAALLAGNPSRVVAFAQRALREADGRPDSVLWSILPWAFPPAYDSLVVAECDSLGLEPALVFATMRQESVFDPQARSVSNALGLMQLLGPAAQDAARWGREPKPTTEAPRLDPVTNLKWGTRYLARQIERFDGRVTAGLSAYNAGPSTLPSFWRDLVAKGGEALFCEVASNADAQLYAKRITGYRAAYRELRPATAR